MESIEKNFHWLIALFAVGLIAASLRMPDSGALTRFSRLPVLQGGRVKPIDTIARTSLLMLRGKQSVVVSGRKLEASEWLLDTISKPEEADGYKVFQINDPDVLGLMGIEQAKEKYFSFRELEGHLQEIEAQNQRAQAVEAQGRDRFQTAIVNIHSRIVLYRRLKNTLHIEGSEDFSKDMDEYEKALIPGLMALQAHSKGRRFDINALRRLGIFVQGFEFLSNSSWFHSLPPLMGGFESGWMNLGQTLVGALRGEALHPLLSPYSRASSGWRHSDFVSFEGATDEIENWWRSRDASILKKASWEALFNHVQPFYQGMILYAAAFLLGMLAWIFRPAALRRSAFHLLILAFLIHTAGMLMRMWLQGRPPVTNLYSSAIFVGWSAVLLGLIMERIHKNGFGGAVSSLVGFCTLIIAHHLMDSGDTLEMMRAVLDSNFWLATHVTVITIGYSSMFLAGSLGLFYLVRRLWSADEEKLRPMAKMIYGVICFALIFSFTGTVLGGIWADQSWGRFWGWDPKENGALLIVLWNALILHARWGGFIRERGLAVTAVFGNIITSLSWFGVNMLGIGLHSYGFMDKALYALSAFIISQLLVMGLGLAQPGSVRLWRQRFF